MRSFIAWQEKFLYRQSSYMGRMLNRCSIYTRRRRESKVDADLKRILQAVDRDIKTVFGNKA